MSDEKIYRASTTAPVNIAVIKYWGKRDPALNLPTNSSLSVTLAQSDLRTHTTASCSSKFSAPDTLLLNSAPQEISSARPTACLTALRSLRAALEDADPKLPKLSTFPLQLVSVNNFPTAAGLASSAAGFAALVRSVADLYALPQTATELSLIARQGSGSACRSLLGGYVAWEKGSRADGKDSIARLVAPRSHWPEMRALILVVSADKKGISSTTGMQATVKTSALFQTRTNHVVPKEMAEIEQAIHAKDFESFGRITMRESNSFHATCLDTEPPIFYLNDVSRAAIRAVEELNTRAGTIVAAYTFDAGPNAVIYHLEENRDLVAGSFKFLLADKEGWNGERGRAIVAMEGVLCVDDKVAIMLKHGVSRVILTGIGEGPISVQEHLVDEQGNVIET
ncbi:diphosphomevalonate decarboxylase [Xylographa trunciseda]|nr:diphosphomevalonate decarboxylase [Xylographa trunciseda]